tara:strand:- start:192 stop:752 length:561 start_codon:yes stop_codon:yes gene_type:complete
MSGCLLTNSKTKDCSTTSKIGGLKGRLWLYNITGSDGANVTYTESGNTITDIGFGASEGLHVVEGEKFAHNFTYAGAAPGINKFYNQGGTIKTVVASDLDIEWLDEVFKASNVGVIYENLNQEFIVLGQYNGLKAIEGDMFDSGLESTAEVGTTITLAGEENKPFKIFFDTDYATTLAKIISLEAV